MRRVKLGKIVGENGVFVDGDWIESKDQDPNGEVRLIQLADIGIGIFKNRSERFLTEKKAVELGCTFLKKGDLLLARLPDPLGRTCVFPGFDYKCITAVDICIIRIENSEVIKDWLMHVLNSPKMKDEIDKYTTGTTRKRISRKNLQKIEIPLPTLAEQKAIVAKLDRAQRLIDIDRQMLAKYDELIQSVFLEMFGDPVRNEKGWAVKTFEEMALFDTHMTSDFDKYGDLLHVGIGNIEKGTGKISGCRTATEEGLTSGKYLFNEEHIIYSKIRPYLNKVALPNFKGLCSADAYPIKPIENVTTRTFLAYLLRSESFLDFISKHSTRTNIPKANKSQMKQFEGIVPPIEFQNQFEELVKRIEKEKKSVQISFKKSEELFSSLVQGVFG